MRLAIDDTRGRVHLKFSRFGIDIDDHHTATLNKALDKADTIGQPYDLRKTAHGYHFRVQLDSEFDFYEIIEMRLFIGDDYKRIILDMLRYARGERDGLDILWNCKTMFNRYGDTTTYAEIPE